MNEVIEQLMSHRSIRKFKQDPIPEATLHAILDAGQMASTSSNVQAYSIIAVKDNTLREQLMALSGNQTYIVQCPVFLVWCADLYRLSRAADKHNESRQQQSELKGNCIDRPNYVDSVEYLLVAAVDTALAAQNAAVAAESLGLGIVYIGGIRNHMEQAAALLELPELVVPLFGMCLGIPDQSPSLRPRLPLDSILHNNTYHPEQADSGIERYDQTYAEYMQARSNGVLNTTWSAQMDKKLQQPSRLHMKDFLQRKGFMRR